VCQSPRPAERFVTCVRSRLTHIRSMRPTAALVPKVRPYTPAAGRHVQCDGRGGDASIGASDTASLTAACGGVLLRGSELRARSTSHDRVRGTMRVPARMRHTFTLRRLMVKTRPCLLSPAGRHRRSSCSITPTATKRRESPRHFGADATCRGLPSNSLGLHGLRRRASTATSRGREAALRRWCCERGQRRHARRTSAGPEERQRA